MQVVHDFSALKRDCPTILTIGAFDGVHRGHQFLIRQVVERARFLGYQSIVVTFDPRPQVVLRPGSTQLTSGDKKSEIIRELDPDVLVVLTFTRELAAAPASTFLQSLLRHIDMREIWVGADFAFGHNREGNVDFLICAGQDLGFAVHVVAREQQESVSISSTRIRELVSSGDVKRATVLLGHYPSLTGEVVRGFGRGADLGFPTANVRTQPWQLLPATGIYAALLSVDTQSYAAAVSVGYNVVFGGQDLMVEAYILDFSGDVRGKIVTIHFVARIRDEQNFDSIDALIVQMHRDVAQVREMLVIPTLSPEFQ